MTTVKDKREALTAWRERVRTSDADYATPEWKESAFATIAVEEEALAFASDDTVLPTFRDVAHNSGAAELFFSAPEREAIVWQYQKSLALGGFRKALLAAVEVADEENLDRLALGFPDLVEGIRRWRGEAGFAGRIRALLANSD